MTNTVLITLICLTCLFILGLCFVLAHMADGIKHIQDRYTKLKKIVDNNVEDFKSIELGLHGDIATLRGELRGLEDNIKKTKKPSTKKPTKTKKTTKSKDEK